MPAQAPLALPLADALQGSDTLKRLAERVRESRQRFACVEGLFPTQLASQAKPGPLDTHGWTLLAASPAVAAKLRQLVPLFEARLAEQGFCTLPTRIKVQPGG